MPYKFETNDLLIRIIPGSLLTIVMFILFIGFNRISFLPKLDFLYTSTFFALSFIAGEVLQTFVHYFEFIIDIFYKGYRPSEIFLYKDNPIVKNNYRNKLISRLKINKEEREIIDRLAYSELPLICGKDDNKRIITQKYFWKIWSKVGENSSLTRTNINYLFVRVIMVDFLILSAILLLKNYLILSTLSFVLSMIFLWRARGLAKGLVFKSVLLFING